MIEKSNLKFKTFKVGIEITYRCNLNCPFCYVNNKLRQVPDISTKKLFPIIDQITETPCLYITLLGGEPFLRQDILDIYGYIIRKGFSVHILTNGTIIRPSVLNYLEKFPPNLISIALYAGTEEGNKKITGSKIAFKSVLKFAKILKNKKIRFRFSTLVNKLNVDEFNKIVSIAEDFNVPLTYSLKIGPCIDGNESPTQLRLSSDERAKVSNLVRIRNRKKIALRDLDEIRGGYCDGGILLIDNFGNLVSCIINRNKYYDLNKIKFRRALLETEDICIKCPCE